VLGAEQLAANRAGEQILTSIGAEERGEDGKGAAGIERDGSASLENQELEVRRSDISYMKQRESQTDPLTVLPLTTYNACCPSALALVLG
jgi:hypothetical protein